MRYKEMLQALEYDFWYSLVMIFVCSWEENGGERTLSLFVLSSRQKLKGRRKNGWYELALQPKNAQRILK